MWQQGIIIVEIKAELAVTIDCFLNPISSEPVGKGDPTI
jgi:hypothetical protein